MSVQSANIIRHEVIRPAKRAENTYTAKLRTRVWCNHHLQQNSLKEMNFSKPDFEMPLSFCISQRVKLGQKDPSIAGGESLKLPQKRRPDYRRLHTFSKYGINGAGARPKSKKALQRLEPEPAFVNLLNCISPLLEKNASKTEVCRVGAQSLFSLCLRKVAEDTAAEEHELEVYDSKSKTYSISHVYKDLEEHFSSGSSCFGWPPLREIVRYHAMHILSHRANKYTRYTKNLYDFLIDEHADNEAKSFFDYRLNDAEDPLALESAFRNSFRWHIFEDFTMLTRQYGYAYQKIAQLLEEYRYAFFQEIFAFMMLHR